MEAARLRHPLRAASAVALVGFLAGASVPSMAQSTAHEPRTPFHVVDLVPAEPGAPASPLVDTPAMVTVIRRLPAPEKAMPDPPEGTDTWYDGETVTIRWDAPQRASYVRFYYYGGRCKIGGRSRGKFEGIINGGMIPNTGELRWKVPWLDGPYVHLRMAAYDAADELVAETESAYRLLPREFAGLPDKCLAISKRLQRLYYVEDSVVKAMHIVSTAARGYTTPKMRPGSHSRRRGAMGKVFGKSYNPFSSLYRVHMPYWLGITSSGSHGIHATSPGFYHRLGRPASHGCVRQHRADARKLYSMVQVGTPVYIF